VSGLEIADGGPSYSVPRLNVALIDAGVDGVIYTDLTPGDAANDEAETIVTFERQFGKIPFLRKLHFATCMQRHLLKEPVSFDLVHSHGLWRMPNIYAARAARRHKIPHLISPRGMLSRVALGFSRTSKELFWHTHQKAAIREATCLHATSMAEHDECRELGISQPIAVVSNGISLPETARHSAPPRDASFKTLLFLGRLHPKKGLDFLISAWAKVAVSFPSWRLRIVGPSEPKHLRELEQLVVARHAPRVTIEAPVYGDEKWRVFKEAEIFVLPTHNENFGLTVAESLACRRPVIVTKGAPWSGVETHNCGWWIETGEAPLIDALRTALCTPEAKLGAMGLRGEAWVKEAFSWDAIGRDMVDVYRWVLGQGPRPACVHQI
jgi:glycosyltransferase involved in cell wall biosynthesis